MLYDTPWDLELLPSISHIRYSEEVDGQFFMKESGTLLGLAGSATLHSQQHIMTRFEGYVATGLINYESNGAGTMSNVEDFLIEVRGIIGWDFYAPRSRITPYIGLGYRFLEDDSAGKFTSTGAIGYDRQSNYNYIPLGIRFDCFLLQTWTVSAALEYDLFWEGLQISEDPFSSYDFENDQNAGFGAKAVLDFKRQWQDFSLTLEPFFNFWHIKDSDLDCAPDSFVCVYEPENESKEIGLRVIVKF